MTTLSQRFFILLFLGFSLALLPACGSNTNVKSQKAAETVLNPEPSPTATPEALANADIPAPKAEDEEKPASSYVEKIKHGKNNKVLLTPATAEATPAPAAAAPAPSNPAPPMEATAPAKGGIHWIWWFILLFLLGGAIWYLRSQKRSGGDPQPNPPVGGLSPVSGYTGRKKDLKKEEKTPFWSKKLF